VLGPGAVKPFSYLYVPSPPFPVNLGNNIWENYQTVSQEIHKKSQKLAEVNAILRQMRVSTDPNHINYLHSQIRGARQELQRISQDNQRAEAALQALTDRAKTLKDAEAAKEAELQRFQLLSKSPQELNAQLTQLKNEHEKIRANVAKMDYDTKIQMDKESREEMEKKMFQIVVEAAQKNPDPRVQAALRRVLANQKNLGLAH
jgi:DNA repair exonuclease SbcCD ATPase subunit